MKRLVIGLGVCCLALRAQTADAAKQAAERKQLTLLDHGPGEHFTMALPFPVGGDAAAIPGAPYSAEANTERVQTLPDGNRIVQTTSSTIARDGQGRVRRQDSLPVGLAGDKDAPKLDFIEDPVAHLHWTLDSLTKTAMKMPQPRRVAALGNDAMNATVPDHAFFYSSGTPGSQISIQTLAKRKGEEETNVTRTDLGTQNLEGVKAQGTRITRTLPAGTVGNEQPLTIVTETWFSPDLKVLVMSKSEDPRIGATTYRLTNIVRGEPSPDLFQIPTDYTVKDQPEDVFFYRQTKKLDE